MPSSRPAAAAAAPPSNLRATVTGNRVSLAWDPSPSDALTGYVLEGGATPGAVLATIPTGSTAPAFTFDAPTGAFFVRMRAVSARATQSALERNLHPRQRAAAAIGAHQPPRPRRRLEPRPQLEDPSAGGAPTSFVLDVSGALTLSVPLPPGETFSFAGVPTGTYTFAVRAANSAGTSPASSPVTLAFPSACPGPPQAPTGFAVTRAGSQLSVSWDPPSAGPAVSSYVLRVTGALNLALPLGARSISGAVPPGIYNLSVLAVNPCGSGEETLPQSVTVP